MVRFDCDMEKEELLMTSHDYFVFYSLCTVKGSKRFSLGPVRNLEDH